MPHASSTLLLTAFFIFLAKVNSSAPPYWLNGEYKFTCKSVCSRYFKGEAFSCFSASPYGLGAGNMIIRILSNLDWRYYKIDDDVNTEDMCQSIMTADQFYLNGNKTVCSTVYKNNNMYYGNARPRSSQGKRTADGTNMRSTNFDENTNAQEQADAPNSKRTESEDVQTKRLLSMARSLSRSDLRDTGLIDDVDSNKRNNNYRSANLVDDSLRSEQYTDPQFPMASLYRNPGVYESGGLKSGTKYNNDETDALCYWMSKDLCQKRKLMLCAQGACCWATLAANICSQMPLGTEINRYRENVYHIILTTKLY